MSGRDESRPPVARLIGASARAGDHFAHATGVNAAIDQAVEEAIVRAFRSQALRRALERALNETDPHSDVDPEELAYLLRRFLDSEAANAAWAEVLRSDQVQMLVERIADAPEVRNAITSQGAGLVTDVGIRLTRLTEALDDAVERVVRRRYADSETNQAGLATRAVAAAVDLGLLALLYLLASSVLSSIFSSTLSGNNGKWPLWLALSLTGLAVLVGGGILVGFWALVGQTPGMRLLSIRIVHGDDHELGLPLALKRMLVLLLGLIPVGLGFLWIARNKQRRGWHDLASGTEVIYEDYGSAAPYSGRKGTTGASRAAD
ncbi:MAG: RDD family protein [Solirubrobacterales bacterium]|nr:RDD family protein [Solirubrobacterales bacterium]